jgi:hypothetical protein
VIERVVEVEVEVEVGVGVGAGGDEYDNGVEGSRGAGAGAGASAGGDEGGGMLPRHVILSESDTSWRDEWDSNVGLKNRTVDVFY